MILKTYLKQNNITVAKFSRDLDVTPQAVFYWMSGDRMPDKESMKKIVEQTNGEVMPNDFYL